LSLNEKTLTNHQKNEFSKKSYISATVVGNILWIPFLLLGSLLLGTANKTLDAFTVALFFLMVGVVINEIFFLGGRYEMRVFLLAYSLCVMFAGFAQIYSLNTFGVLQSTKDSFTFFNLISSKPPFTSARQLSPLFNFSLAILIWQQIYKLTWFFRLQFGPYTGVLFNGFLVGLSGTLTVRIARELYGDDNWRLRRVKTLYASCGIFILFGAIFLRDCFTLFFNTLILWMIIRYLCRSTLKNLAKALILIAFICWFFNNRRINTKRIILILLIPLILLFTYKYLQKYYSLSSDITSKISEGYASWGKIRNRSGSLGMALVVNQPTPIKLVLGSGYMMLFPSPFWAGISCGASEYHLIKTWQALYKILIMPLVLVAFLMLAQKLRKEFKKPGPFFFLACYALLSLMAVVLITLETRHLGQFFPAFILIAAIPDTRNYFIARRVKKVAYIWFPFVVTIHILWAFLRFC